MKRHASALPPPFRYQDFRRAHEVLSRALRQNGYALLLGESGTGKTTLLRDLAAGLDRSRYSLLYLCHGRPSPSALARVLAEALHLPLQRTRAEMSRLLMQHLRAWPTRLLLWIDETQLISEDTLHEIRLMAEADLEGPPLFSVILAALPELKERLLAPNLFPLWRRILSPRHALRFVPGGSRTLSGPRPWRTPTQGLHPGGPHRPLRACPRHPRHSRAERGAMPAAPARSQGADRRRSDPRAVGVFRHPLSRRR